MKPDALLDATGTIFTCMQPGFQTDAFTTFWQDQMATQGTASYLPQPRVTAYRGTADPSGFFALQSASGCVVWQPFEPEAGVIDVELLESSLATAYEASRRALAANLVAFDCLQQTDYRFVVPDMSQILREMFAYLPVNQQRITDETPQPDDTRDTVRSRQIEEIKELADLTNDQLAELFQVSRTSVQSWIAGGGMRRAHQEHLRQILAIFRAASRRVDSREQLHELLLTPIGKAQRRPFDYLSDRQYAVARGYLQPSLPTDRYQLRRPITPRVMLSEEDRRENLEHLSPSPRDPGDHE